MVDTKYLILKQKLAIGILVFLSLSLLCFGKAHGGEPAQTTTTLPASFLGTWCEIKPWSGAKDGPFFYKTATITSKTLTITRGEVSKDSGSETLEGTYSSAAMPLPNNNIYRLNMTVNNHRASNTVGGQITDNKQGKNLVIEVGLKNNELLVSLPSFVTMAAKQQEACAGLSKE